MVNGLTALLSAFVGWGIAIFFAEKIFDFLIGVERHRGKILRIVLLAAVGFVVYFTVNQDVIFTHLSYLLLGFLVSSLYYSALIYQKSVEVFEKMDARDSEDGK